MSDLIGAVLGNYRIVSEISSGGMGTVYRAEHQILGRAAAVKLLRPELTASQELVDRFFNEAKAATAIRHPGIVEVYDFGYTNDGRAYLVMELLVGKTLGKALADVERFTESEAANIAKGIASALKAAHGQGIVHRDLKPDNVFLVPDLEGQTGATRAKVLDFGIAKLLTANVHHTQTGVLMGTPLYMAPEQARAASAIDHRADLYSLGCILYELIVGTPPFVAEGAGELIALHMFAEPEPPRSRVADLSPEIDAVVMKLLAKEPHDRYQTASAVIAALTGIARMSGELSALSAASGARPMVISPSTLRASSGQLDFAREAPPRESHRSAMPIVAGVLTLLIAAAVVVFVMSRGGGDTSAEAKPAPHFELQPIAPSDLQLPPEPVERAPVKNVTEPPPVPSPVKTNPAKSPTKPIGGTIKPKGPTTSNGSPIETDVFDSKKKTP